MRAIDRGFEVDSVHEADDGHLEVLLVPGPKLRLEEALSLRLRERFAGQALDRVLKAEILAAVYEFFDDLDRLVGST